MKVLYHHLLSKLEMAKEEIDTINEKTVKNEKLRHVFSEFETEFDGTIALNFNEHIESFLGSFEYDINRIMNFVKNHIEEPYVVCDCIFKFLGYLKLGFMYKVDNLYIL